MSDSTHPTARVSRIFSASPETVFDAWFNPAMISQWMFGPHMRKEEVLRIALDPRVGGFFSFVVRKQDKEIDHIGKYLEIDRPRRLSFTWGTSESAGENKGIIDITRTPRGCQCNVAHEMPATMAEHVSRAENAWGEMLDALARTLVTN